MRDARPALASGASVGSSRGAEGAESIGLPPYPTCQLRTTMTRLRQSPAITHGGGQAGHPMKIFKSAVALAATERSACVSVVLVPVKH